ncbi:MAG: repeat protein, partial [Myxococcaceae bacterium]|nr:repeat protein [Myxococcaceae bacterium]
FALGQLGDGAIAAMCEALVGRRDHEARIAALVDALAASRGSPEAALLALLGSKDPAVICDAAQILGRRQCAAALAPLAALVEHGDDNVSVSAIEALGRIGGAQSVDRLIRVLESGNFFRVFPAIEVVGRLGDVRATAPLVKLSGIALYTLEASRALGRLGDVRAMPALAALLVNPGDPLVRTAAAALWELHSQRFGEAASLAARAPAGWAPEQVDASVQRLINASPGGAPFEQRAIAHLLGWFGTREAIVGLLELLEVEGEVGQAAGEALAGLGGAVDCELLPRLRSGDSARRGLLLPLVGRSPARPEVELCLRDGDPAVRVLACQALARLGDPAAVPALFELLGEATQVCQSAVNAILSLGSPQTERLALEAARSSNPQQRRGGVRIIATLGYESGLPALLAAIEDEDERLRDIALPGLALLERPAALDALLAAASHPSTRTCAAAVRALGQASSDARIGPALGTALGHPDAWVRYQACHALGRRKEVGSIDALMERLDDEAGQVRIATVDALSHLPGKVAREVLGAAVNAADPDMRRAALVGLGLRGEPDVLPTLLEGARASDVATRLVALSALASFGQPEAFAAQVQAAADPDEVVRAAAIAVLAAVPGRAASQVLIGLLSGRLSRAPALTALARPLEGRVPALLEALERSDERLAGLLAAILARLADAGAADGLVLALGSPNVEARRAAAAVLDARASSKARAALLDSAARDPDYQVRRLAAAALEG